MTDRQAEDQRSQMVVKGNDAIQKARYRLTATQQKFICYLVSKIEPTDEDFKEYSIRVEDFCELINIDKNHFYGEFRQMVDDLDVNKSFWVKTDKEMYKFRWFDDTTYVIGAGTIKVTLSKRLKEYFLQLTQNFTQYELYNVLALKSKYSIRLFELFKSYEYLHEKIFDVEELKELLDAETYKKYSDFRLRVLEPAKKEINKYTELKIDFDPIYKGKRIGSIRFTIEQKKSFDKLKSYEKTVKKKPAGADMDPRQENARHV